MSKLKSAVLVLKNKIYLKKFLNYFKKYNLEKVIILTDQDKIFLKDKKFNLIKLKKNNLIKKNIIKVIKKKIRNLIQIIIL